MTGWWAEASGGAAAAFLAALVEFIEALTVVLAIGAVRGWAGTLAGAAAAGCTLVVVAALFGPALAGLDLAVVKLVVGVLVLLFGLRWLRKAILRSAGVWRLRTENDAYGRARNRFAGGPTAPGWEWFGFSGAFQVVLLEGTEVVFIVIAIGSGTGRLGPASLGAGLALACVVLLGVWLHRPIARIPENLLKTAVGILLASFGTFWTGEAIGVAWPGGAWGLPRLVLVWTLVTLALIRLAARARAARRLGP